MAVMDRLRGLFGAPLKARNPASIVPGVLSDAPQYPTPTYVNYANEAFARNELVYACVMEIATSAPEAPLRVYRDGEVDPNHGLRKLIQRPNPFMTEFELWELSLVHLYLSGNCFWEKVRSGSDRVVELWPLRPDLVQIIPSSDKLIAGYQYVVNGVPYPIAARDIVHFKFPHPLDPFFGLPPLRAAVRAVATDNEATDYVKVLLQNHAIPGVVITTQEAVDEATTTRLTEKWRQKFGKGKRGEPAFLQAGMDVKTLAQTLRDLEFPDLRNISESRICGVFGVPPILVGANVGLQRSTFSNYGEARRSFWEETIGPLHRRLRDRVALQLLPEFGTDGADVRFDTSDVSALQENENEKWTRATAALRAGLITRDEARSEIGHDPGDTPDVYLLAGNVQQVPADGKTPAKE